MSTVTTDVGLEHAFARIRRTTQQTVKRAAEKYARTCRSPHSDPEEFEQHVWFRLWEWLTEAADPDTVEALTGDPAQARKFMTTFSRARLCDQIDVILAGSRDQRQTVNASLPANEDGGTIIDLHGAATQPVEDDLVLAEALDATLTYDTRSLLSALTDPPAQVREAFSESRLKPRRGTALLADAATEHGTSTLSLTCLEGSHGADDRVITWTGPIGTGPLDTDLGPATAKRTARDWLISWEPGHVVRLDRLTLEGEFLLRVIRPSPRAFNLDVMADHLGFSKIRTIRAWAALRTSLKGFIDLG